MSGGDLLSHTRWQRLTDRWRGRRDGRRRVPSYGEMVELANTRGVITAPYPELLAFQSLRRIENERLAFEQRAAAGRTTLARLREELSAATVGLDRASVAVQEAQEQLTEVELRPRNHAELAPEHQATLLSRRDAVRNRRIAAARGAEADQFAELNAVVSQVAAVKEQIRKEFVVAQATARQLGAHCAVRVAAYWENVVVTHPDGPHLVPLLNVVTRVLPSWVVAPVDGDPAELGRGPSELHEIAQQLHVPSRRQGRGTEAAPDTRPEPDHHEDTA